MKKIFKTILAVTCFTAIILAGCENLDGSCDLPWTLTWIAVAYVAARRYKKMEESDECR